MGRPAKNNCDYYPHLCTMRNHRKIKALRNKFGSVVGYAFWSMFIEYLTELDGNVFEYSDLECELFAAELGVTVAEIKEMIEFCIKIELLFIKGGFVHSHSLDEKLQPVYEKRKRNKDLSATQKRRGDGKFVSNQTSIGLTEAETTDIADNTHSESPQIELNRIKVNKIEGNDSLFLSFENFWDLYDKKIGRYKCEKKWNKLTDEEKEKIIKTLPIWLKSIKNKQYQLHPETYLNGKHWEDEIILDTNPIINNHKSVDKATAKQIAENEKLSNITPDQRKSGWELE